MRLKSYIILPVYNRKQITERFIDCLLRQTYQNYHLILVDDGSDDGTAEMVKRQVKNLTVISGTGNWWWAGCLQQGIKWLEDNNVDPEDVVVFINDDVVYEVDFLEKAARILEMSPNTLVLPHIQDEETNRPVSTGVEVDFSTLILRNAINSESVNCLPTRGLFMRWGDVQKVGKFYPFLLPHYLSDYEFTLRAYRKGFKLLSSPDLVITANLEATGYRNLQGVGFKLFMRSFFSKKSVANPVYWTVFVLLACPFRWIPINVFRVWKRALFMVLKNAGNSLTVRE